MTTASAIKDARNCGSSSCTCKSNGNTHCPVASHPDTKPSLSVKEEGGKLLVHCHGGCSQEAVVDALKDQSLWPPSSNGTKAQPKKPLIAAVYEYQDEEAALLFQALRYEPKDFRQRRPDGKGGWIYNLEGVRRVLYRLPELIAADPVAFVFTPEGEKDVDRLRGMGLTATCNPMGAGKWLPEYSESLRDRVVVLIEDNDEPGRKHVQEVARSLRGIAKSIRVLGLRSRKEHADISDWIDEDAENNTAARLEIIAGGLPEVKFAEDAPLATLLDDVHGFLARFVAYPDEHTHDAHTLWVAHTHCMDSWESTPRLAALSPEPGSGKTRLIEVTELLVPRPVLAVNVTAAYLFRKVGDPAGLPTILYDEIDTVFGPRAKENEDIRGLLNAGHRKGAVAGRCVVKGKIIETEEIPAYSAVALAGLGGLPDTLLSRSVIIRMKRRAPGEVIEPFRRRLHEAEGYALRDQLATWGERATPTLRAAWPELPEGVTDRNADLWEPLVAIADAAGGSWPARARGSAVALVADSMAGTPSLNIRLLEDIRTVFGDDAETLPTAELVKALNALDEAPWATLKYGALNPRGLSQRLREYGIKSKDVRQGERNENKVVKGYVREDFQDAWERYLSPLGLSPMGNATSAINATNEEPTKPDFRKIIPRDWRVRGDDPGLGI